MLYNIWLLWFDEKLMWCHTCNLYNQFLVNLAESGSKFSIRRRSTSRGVHLPIANSMESSVDTWWCTTNSTTEMRHSEPSSCTMSKMVSGFLSRISAIAALSGLSLNPSIGVRTRNYPMGKLLPFWIESMQCFSGNFCWAFHNWASGLMTRLISCCEK